MQATRKKQKLQLGQLMALYPRKHLIVASCLVAFVFVCLLLAPSQEAEAKRISLPVELQLEPATSISVNTSQPLAETLPPESMTSVSMASEPEPLTETPWQEVEIRNGDNLSIIFQRASLSANDVYAIVNNSEDSADLLKLRPGQKLAFQTDESGKLSTLKYIKNQLHTTLFERDGNNFNTSHIQRDPEVRQQYASSMISNSLYRAAQNSGLSQELIMEMADVFGGVIDFVYDVRAGDVFSVIYEELYLDDQKTGNGAILAAQFTNQGKTYTAYRYKYSDGSIGYYNEEGISMRKAFLRAPLDFTRISSGFNLNRLHPIFKTTRPHRGIDYAASRGTPIYAAGDGRVVSSGFSNANGNYVVINHGSRYVTKYLHLQKRVVKQGQKISQRQVIGTVGSTGYATGPHLHYEFLVDGVHRNPRTILDKLPKAKTIASADKQRFLAQITDVQLQLATYNNNRRLASNNQASDKSTL